jgi:hypothetical protein
MTAYVIGLYMHDGKPYLHDIYMSLYLSQVPTPQENSLLDHTASFIHPWTACRQLVMIAFIQAGVDTYHGSGCNHVSSAKADITSEHPAGSPPEQVSHASRKTAAVQGSRAARLARGAAPPVVGLDPHLQAGA